MRPAVKHAPVYGHHNSLTRKLKVPNCGGWEKGRKRENIMKACSNIKIHFNPWSAG